MDNRICDMLGIEFPLVAFTHCRDVVAEVSKAGGLGVLGAARLTPEQLEVELGWIDQHIGGKPYGVDLIVPNKFVGKDDQPSPEQFLAMLPDAHKKFANDILADHGIDSDGIDAARRDSLGYRDNLSLDGAKAHLEVAFLHVGGRRVASRTGRFRGAYSRVPPWLM